MRASHLLLCLHSHPRARSRRARASSSGGRPSQQGLTRSPRGPRPQTAPVAAALPTLALTPALAVGAAEAALALGYGHLTGVAVGLGALLLGGDAPLVGSASAGGGTLVSLAGILLAVRLLTLDGTPPDAADPGGFPDAPYGMGALAGSYRCVAGAEGAGRLAPARAPGDVAAVAARVERWVAQEGLPGSSRVLSRVDAEDGSWTVLRTRHVTPLMGFADDGWARVTRAGASSSLVEFQGQLRLGGSDLGVNYARAGRLMAFVARDNA